MLRRGVLPLFAALLLAVGAFAQGGKRAILFNAFGVKDQSYTATGDVTSPATLTVSAPGVLTNATD